MFVLNVVDGCMPSDLGRHYRGNRGRTSTSLRCDDSREGLSAISSFRNASLPMGNIRRATATSTPRGRVSFRTSCSTCSRKPRGRCRWPPPQRAPQARVRVHRRRPRMSGMWR